MKKQIFKAHLLATLFLLLSVTQVCAADPAQVEAQLIDADEFVQSPAAELFKTEDYERALPALDELIRRFPQDSMLLRYRAMSLDRLGRSQEAIDIFRNILNDEPGNVPARYYLGQAYERNGQRELALDQWSWVKDNSKEGPYAEWANAALADAGSSVQAEEKRQPKLFLTGRYGYEFDSNVTLRPSDKSLTLPSDNSAGRQVADVSARYRLMKLEKTTLDAIYTFRHSFHDSGLDEFNYMSHETGLDLRHRVKFGGQEYTLGARYDFLAGFLHGDTFSLRHRIGLSADTRFTKFTRTAIDYQIIPTDFGPDGSNPSQTSRDGLYHDAGVTQYWYYGGNFQRYVFARGGYRNTQARGFNFDERGAYARVGWHVPAPFLPKTDLDLSAGIEHGEFPNFISQSSLDRDRREDLQTDLYGALTYYITPKVGIRGFYRYINADNDNGFFEYTRHVGGVQLLFSEAF